MLIGLGWLAERLAASCMAMSCLYGRLVENLGSGSRVDLVGLDGAFILNSCSGVGLRFMVAPNGGGQIVPSLMINFLIALQMHNCINDAIVQILRN